MMSLPDRDSKPSINDLSDNKSHVKGCFLFSLLYLNQLEDFNFYMPLVFL